MAEPSVFSAAGNLARMERRLRRNVKRQKPEGEENAVLRRTRKTKVTPGESTTTVPLPKPKSETVEGVSEDDTDGATEDLPGAVPRDTQRPLPVNSDYLPLPWKGRLGYVSPYSHPYLNYSRTLTERLGLP